jgi:hypothetical protein
MRSAELEFLEGKVRDPAQQEALDFWSYRPG